MPSGVTQVSASASPPRNSPDASLRQSSTAGIAWSRIPASEPCTDLPQEKGTRAQDVGLSRRATPDIYVLHILRQSQMFSDSIRSSRLMPAALRVTPWPDP